MADGYMDRLTALHAQCISTFICKPLKYHGDPAFVTGLFVCGLPAWHYCTSFSRRCISFARGFFLRHT